jgi:hypothetical protein
MRPDPAFCSAANDSRHATLHLKTDTGLGNAEVPQHSVTPCLALPPSVARSGSLLYHVRSSDQDIPALSRPHRRFKSHPLDGFVSFVSCVLIVLVYNGR